MKKTLISLTLLSLSFSAAHALPNGAPICSVEADFSNITGMGSRTRNQTPGSYIITAPATYTPGETIDITVSGPQFTGIMFAVVDDNDNNVGTFSPDVGTNSCDGASMAITHSSSFGNQMSRTLEWTAPNSDVGTVYVEGYVLAGARGDQQNQEFFRLVRDSGAAVIEGPPDVIFEDGFDNP
ncbi:reeler domain-containing protein [Marinicella sp. W31]|uniref:reeler domain-containing protein n=1 Tax=Marinicella sp. W31 TaxID=3023713 RepID=UPI003756BB31